MKSDESGQANDQDVRQKKCVSYKEELREGQGAASAQRRRAPVGSCTPGGTAWRADESLSLGLGNQEPASH